MLTGNYLRWSALQNAKHPILDVWQRSEYASEGYTSKYEQTISEAGNGGVL